MFIGLDLDTLRFGAPAFLWLLLVPAALLVLWTVQVVRHRADAKRLQQHRKVPVRQAFPVFGGLLFWLCALIATASLVVAVARPEARVSVVRTAGIDLVILQDGSTSMQVTDVEGNRWQRSMRFLRFLGESLRWQDDRLALALFARVAAPQLRLTRDPNTLFFFLDHLSEASPFRLEDDGSWDTNIEVGIAWGLRLVEKDEELNGRTPNAKAFVLLSDGQQWSGEVARALAAAKDQKIPVHVIGVGTSAGGYIPEPPRKPPAEGEEGDAPSGPIFSTLDRASLTEIATAGGGGYFELDRESDREIAAALIDATRRRAAFRGVEENTEPLYWRFLALAAAFAGLGVVFLRERSELWLQLLGAAAVLAAVTTVIR